MVGIGRGEDRDEMEFTEEVEVGRYGGVCLREEDKGAGCCRVEIGGLGREGKGFG